MDGVPGERHGDDEADYQHTQVHAVEHQKYLSRRRAHHLAYPNLLPLVFAVENDEAEDADDGDEYCQETKEED